MALRMGMVGVGGLGYLQANTYADIDGVTIACAADVSAEARELFVGEFRATVHEHYADLLEAHASALDAITIVTPHALHYEQAMAALRHELHVLVEKPMVTDVAHAVDLVDAAEERNLVLQVGYQRHFHPAFREVRRILDAGRIGELHAVSCHLGQDWIEAQRDTWRTDPSLSGGGQLYDTGSHLLDALLWTTRTTPERVLAEIEFAEPDVDVNSALSMRLAREGSGGAVTAGATVSGDGNEITPSEGYVFWGTDGRIAYEGDTITVAEQGAVTYRTEFSEEVTFQGLNTRKLNNFAASIAGTAEPAVPGEVGLRVTALVEAAYRSAATGSVVDVPSLIDDARSSRG